MSSIAFGIAMGLAIAASGAREPEPWTTLLVGSGMEGWKSGGPHFTREGRTIHGADGGSGDRLMTGDESWTDYEFAAEVTPMKGPLIQLHYRVGDGGKRWYTLDLRPEQGKATMSAADQREGRNAFEALVAKPMAVTYGTEYALRVVVRGSRATGYVNDVEIGTVEGVQAPAGAVGLGLFASAAAFREPRIRRLP